MLHPMRQPDFFPRLRLDAVTDGVLAITMTLLVLSLDVPDTLTGGLMPALVELRPKLFSWVVSFLILAQFWVTQVRATREVEHVDSGLFRITVLWLLFISLLPFSTSLIGEHPDFLGSHIVYATNLIGVELAVIWRSHHFRRHPELFAPGADTRAAEMWFRPFAVLCCAAISVAVATFWTPEDSSIAYLLLFPLVLYWERRR
jgi:uncharacterized membrane protein